VRTYYAEVPPRVEYEISELGGGLAGLFADLTQWGLDNLPQVQTARGRFDSSTKASLAPTLDPGTTVSTKARSLPPSGWLTC